MTVIRRPSDTVLEPNLAVVWLEETFGLHTT